MSEPGDFLARWSRRKRAAAEAKSAPAQEAVQQAAQEPAQESAQESARESVQAENQSAAPAEAEFDLTSLPPLDTIAADTDIRAFLKPGVPTGLRAAALRRAWTADPAIRDFRGLQENDWDFNDPDSIPGFGTLAPDFDARKMTAQVFGDARDRTEPKLDTDVQAVPAAQESEHADDPQAAAKEAAVARDAASLPAPEQEMLQREQDVAMREEEPSESVAQVKPRRHGGALPRLVPE